MLTPTHIQVAVLHTRNLIIKGKNGTNDPFIIFTLGKQKFQSSVKEKVSDCLMEWNEGCDMAIPTTEGNKSDLTLKLLHKASMGERFLGRVSIPLSEFDVMAKPKAKWYPLKNKPGNEKDTKYRGEIEIKVNFLIKSANSEEPNLTKRRGSLKSSLGSLLSIGKKKKLGPGSSKDSISSSTESLRNINSSRLNLNNNLPIINDDPGVISEEEDVDEKSKSRTSLKPTQSNASISGSVSDKLDSPGLPSTPKSKGFRGIFSSRSQNTSYEDLDDIPSTPKPRVKRLPSVIVEEPPILNQGVPFTAPSSPKPPPKLTVSASMSNLMDAEKKGHVKKSFKSMFTSNKHLNEIPNPSNGQDASASPSMKRGGSLKDLKITKEIFKQYERKSKEELVSMIINLQNTVGGQNQKISDLEDYIDKLLLRVLDNMPVLLKKGNSTRGNSFSCSN